MIKRGSTVTWGSGEPRAKVKNTDGWSGDVRLATCELLHVVKSPCGKRWEKGTEIHVPVEALREVS